VKRKEKFKAQTSAGDVMVSVLWDIEGILLVGFLKRGATIQSDMWQTSKKLIQRIRRVRPDR
jgi:hypothetical protein